ncbi:MAG: methyltransferase [Alphaproteobacteria bacterium]|nr:methyltransferase [Alphaproteobacteria bacterium]
MQVTAQAYRAPPPPPPPGLGVPATLTEDGFLGGRLRVLQPEKGYRAGIDAVFLAAAVPCGAGETLYEAGIGTGVASLCLLARCPEIHVTGIEVASRYAMLCEENAKRNGFGGSIRVIHADIKEALRKDLASMPSHGSFSHAFANPPYFEEGKSTPSPNLLKAAAHAFGPEDLDLWMRVLHTMVTLRGTVTVVHRAETLGKLLAVMEDRFGDIRIAPLYAREGTAASRVIVQGVKGSKAPMQLLPGLVLHDQNSQFTPEADSILRDGLAWRLR